MKGSVTISHLELSYTSEMEKAMYKAHGVGYEQYSRQLGERMKVEQKRDQDYLKGKSIVANHGKQLQSHS